MIVPERYNPGCPESTLIL